MRKTITQYSGERTWIATRYLRAIFIGTDGDIGSTVVSVYYIHSCSGSVAFIFSVSDDGQDFCFSQVG